MGEVGQLSTVQCDDGVVQAVSEVDASRCSQLDEMLYTLADLVQRTWAGPGEL